MVSLEELKQLDLEDFINLAEKVETWKLQDPRKELFNKEDKQIKAVVQTFRGDYEGVSIYVMRAKKVDKTWITVKKGNPILNGHYNSSYETRHNPSLEEPIKELYERVSQGRESHKKAKPVRSSIFFP